MTSRPRTPAAVGAAVVAVGSCLALSSFTEASHPSVHEGNRSAGGDRLVVVALPAGPALSGATQAVRSSLWLDPESTRFLRGAPAGELALAAGLIVGGGGTLGPAAAAVRRGACVINLGRTLVTGATQNVVLDTWAAGYKIGEETGRWAAAARSDAVIVLDKTSLRSGALAEAMRAGFSATAPRARIVASPRVASAAESARLARQLLRQHRRARAFLTTGARAAVGVSRALRTRREAQSAYVATVGTEPSVLTLLRGRTPVRSTWSFYETLSGVRAVQDAARCLAGEPVPKVRYQVGSFVRRRDLPTYRQVIRRPLGARARALAPRVMRECSC